MIKYSKAFITFLFLGLTIGCSQVLQTVKLELNSEDNSAQDDFNVVEKVLTIEEAQKQNSSPYERSFLQSGRGNNARTVSENTIVRSQFPDKKEFYEYKIGVGDALTVSRVIENNYSRLNTYNEWPKNLESFNYKLGVGDNLALTILRVESTLSSIPTSSDNGEDQSLLMESQKDLILESKGRIGSDGSVLLLEVGRLEAKGKTLNELQSEVRNILIRNGTSPRFQLEIVEFKSRKAYLTVNNSSKVILLDDQTTTLRDVLTSAEVGFKPGVITRIRLQRNSKEYQMSLRSIFSQNAPILTIYSEDHIFVEDSSSDMASSVSVVGHDGNVVFPGIGKIEAVDRTLSELTTEISNLIEKIPGSENSFQVQITKFSSQTALLTISGKIGAVIPISDTPTALDEVLTTNGLNIDGNSITRINLQRQGKSYIFTLDDLLKPSTGKIYIQPNDRIAAETLPYKENKVFILGGVNPQIFKIKPENRETLADVLFTSGGVLSSSSARRSQVYLLRGNEPVVAYHLDAQSPTRLIVAEAMELRPNDILYVAEQPIISFNRTLATIVPLRVLLRDIQDENIP